MGLNPIQLCSIVKWTGWRENGYQTSEAWLKYQSGQETQRWITPIITSLYGYLPRELME